MLSIKSKKHTIRIYHKIIQTTSSVVYKAQDEISNKDLAVKVERNQGSKTLLNEIKIANFLEDCPGIVKLIDYGFYENKRFLVYPFLSRSLYNTVLSRKDLHKCAKQMIKTLELIHAKGIVHCDISSRNVLYSSTRKDYYLNDFGQSRHYDYTLEDAKTTELVGSPTYCSHHIHKYYEYMPRDDLISLGYLLYYCATGSLPWCGLKTCREIKEKKIEFMDEYWNSSIPQEVKIFLNYSFHLGMNEKPDYSILVKLFGEGERNEIRMNRDDNIIAIPI
jgi:serine/threonine protein kinase